MGSLNELEHPTQGRMKHALITASRLAKRKHIDWIVNAVIAAKNSVPDLSLDIYGTGGEAGMLTNLINQNQAQDYIHIMGQRDLTKSIETILLILPLQQVKVLGSHCLRQLVQD